MFSVSGVAEDGTAQARLEKSREKRQPPSEGGGVETCAIDEQLAVASKEAP